MNHILRAALLAALLPAPADGGSPTARELVAERCATAGGEPSAIAACIAERENRAAAAMDMLALMMPALASRCRDQTTDVLDQMDCAKTALDGLEGDPPPAP